MATQGYAHGTLTEPLAISRRRIEIIDATLQGFVDRPVDLFLINYILPVVIFHCRQTHASVTEYRHPIAC